MNEIELKILLDPRQERLLRSGAAVKRAAAGRARTKTLVSTYYDTADRALQRAGIALRVRRDGRRRIQTVKKAPEGIRQGLSMPIENECLLDGDAPDLARIRDEALRAEVTRLAAPGLAPTVETAFRRTGRLLKGPAGGRVELAIDVGELRANGAATPLSEAELEVREGPPGDIFALARDLFAAGPVRFSNRSKSERAGVLRDGGTAIEPPAPVKARPAKLDREMTVEAAAVAVLNEIQHQIAANIVATIETDDVEGPHQLRVGLRRLRSALDAFAPALGCAEFDRLAERARQVGANAGRLRDLDVFAGEVLAPAAAGAPDEPGFARLIEAVALRRAAMREEVREALSGHEVAAFVLDLAGFVATRGWRADADEAALSAPVGKLAKKALARRWKALKKRAKGIGELTRAERHEMRKALKKLRYVVESFESLYAAKRVRPFRKALRRLQDDFGTLNDAAMSEALLRGANAPGAGEPDAQRAAGRVIGAALARADDLWPRTVADWRTLAGAGPFWR